MSVILVQYSLLSIFADLNNVQIGPYFVQNCKSKNQNITFLLNSLRTVLRPVITDLGSSPASDAYATFFKDVSYASYVRDIFTNITIGASVPPEPHLGSFSPNIICIDGRDQVAWDQNNKRVDAYDRCAAGIEVGAIALLKTPYILICPKFFNHPALPVKSTTSCYALDSNRKWFLDIGISLTKYQIWLLIHELVHYYVWTTKQQHLDVYNINRCLLLPGSSAVMNPQSYVYYAASKR